MKLVRDLIPDIAAAKGQKEPFRQVIDRAEQLQLLDAKLDEELAEWREGYELEELADLLAVVRATALMYGWSWAQLLETEEAKSERCGGFLGGVVWLGTKRQAYDPGST